MGFVTYLLYQWDDPWEVPHQDTVIDLKHLSFSDWLASVDVSLNLQQYLPCIQESYDTVSQRLGGHGGKALRWCRFFGAGRC